MSTIRRQSIISSGVVYIGFAIGFINTYLFVKEGGFTQSQYGLTVTFISIANIMYSLSNLGMQYFIYRFYPYYHDNLPPQKNDMLSISLLFSTIGFLFVTIFGLLLKDLVVRKFTAHSPELVKYYYWTFIFGFGLTMFTIVESFAWQLKESVLSTTFKEVVYRLLTTTLICLALFKVIPNFDLFIKLYSLGYLVIVILLLAVLFNRKKIHLPLVRSRLTRRLSKKIWKLILSIWFGLIIHNIATFYAAIVIAAVLPNGLAYAGIFALAQNIASLIQAPQRGIIAASVAYLSKAWKDKDMEKIQSIYYRSSINQLIFASGMFVLIWINFTDAVLTFHFQKGYLEAQNVFLFIGIMRVIDMGTGVNSQIITTSKFWAFEFWTGMILLLLVVVLNYVLTKKIGVTGPAIGELIALIVYNFIRFVFLYRKFGMSPFKTISILPLLLAFAGYLVCHVLFKEYSGLIWIVVRSLVFLAIYLSGVIFLNISPDINPVLATVKKRLGIRR
jgi:O-antigen/teichoic acid export membrane protein